MWTCGCAPENNIMIIDDVPNNIMMDPLKLFPYLDNRGAGNAGICLLKKKNHEDWFNKVYTPESVFHGKKIKIIEQIALPVNGYYQQSSELFSHSGNYQNYQLPKKNWTVKNYIDYARQNDPSPIASYYDLEDQFWKNVGNEPLRLYAADLRFSMMNPDVEGLNFNNWSTYLSRFTSTPLIGIETPFSYLGKWMTNFPWHTEENELFSMNISYDGCKGWYSVDRNQTEVFNQFVNNAYAEVSQGCGNFTRHKRVILSPTELEEAGIHVHKVLQEPGDIVITFPGGLHSGINFQYNRNEAIGMACRGWAKFCRTATYCDCPKKMKVCEALDDITPVVRQLEPQKYSEWLRKDEITPTELPKRVTRNSAKLSNVREEPSTVTKNDNPRNKVRRQFLTHEAYEAYQHKQNIYRTMAKRPCTMRSSQLHTRRNDWNNPDYTKALRWILNHPEKPIGRPATFVGVTPAALLKHMYTCIFPSLSNGETWGLEEGELEALKNTLSQKSPKFRELIIS